ncbi:MAG: AarF/ABC1/UbiB kinase family protein [Nitrospirae bacterium]|nr:AarF/ABC1/UbiB kinase family protein [Nitrospirota bacterium]
MPFYHFKQTYRDIQRVRLILNTLIKYGFGYLIESLNLQGYVPLGKRIFKTREKEDSPKNTAERFRLVLEELGPTFIKFGQILSLRRDILSEEYVIELQRLQDHVPPFPVEQAREEILAELGKPVDKLYSFFDETPLAAASIGQVHRARLPDGREVVVKIQRPGIRDTIETDLSILLTLARLIKRYIPEAKLYDPVGMVEEFSLTIRKELDFRIEGRSADRFRTMFDDSKDVYIPEVIWDISGSHILTIEYAPGKRITEVGGDAHSRYVLAKKFSDSYLLQLFDHGFFHADPHPGNVVVLDDGRICFHDFGIMGRLDDEMMENLSGLFIAVIERDIGRLMDIYLEIGIILGDYDQKALKKDIREFIDGYYDVPLKDFSFAEFVNGIIALGRRHHIKISTDLLLFGKAFMTVESIVRTLAPEFNLVENIRPYTQHLLRKRLFEPSRIYNDMIKIGLEVSGLLRELPRELHHIFKRIREGRIEIEVRHEKLEGLEQHIDKASNRLSFSLIIASIIIGSSIIMQTQIGPLFLGFPLLGAVGYIVAGLLGLWLVWAIIRSGRL